MGDSMYQEDPKGLSFRKTKAHVDPIQEEGGNPNNDSQLTGNFEKDVNQSGAHYMNDLTNSQKVEKGHYMDKSNTLQRTDSIQKASNRRSNRKSGKTVQAPE
jgi:hypothetical protein